MQKKVREKDFDYYVDEYLYYCQSKRLRPKTLNSYEQTLRLFERWCYEQENITCPAEVREAVVRHYICDLQERGKYSFYANEDRESVNCPQRRRDYRQPVSITTINNYIRNLRAFFNWYASDLPSAKNPMTKIKQMETERRPKEYLEDDEVRRLLNGFDKSYYSEARDSVVVMLLLDTGMRLGECLMLTVSQIDLVERTIEIPSELTKGRRARSVFFSMKTARAMQRWLCLRATNEILLHWAQNALNRNNYLCMEHSEESMTQVDVKAANNITLTLGTDTLQLTSFEELINNLK